MSGDKIERLHKLIDQAIDRGYYTGSCTRVMLLINDLRNLGLATDAHVERLDDLYKAFVSAARPDVDPWSDDRDRPEEE